MKLDLEILRPLIHGALRTTETPEGLIHFDRLPEGLRSTYENNPGAVTRLLCPAGVRVRFQCATSSIRIALRYFTFARAYFKGTIAIDRGEPETFGPDEKTDRWEGEIHRSSTGSQKTLFDIWMPHLAHAEIEFLELDDQADPRPAPSPTLRWLAYGDSITQGMTVVNPALSLTGVAARDLDADVLNLGVGGARVVPEMSDDIPDWDYDVASIAYGTNDFNHGAPLADYEANLRSLVSALRQKSPKKPIFMISVIPWANRTTPNKNGIFLADYRAIAENVADELEGVVNVPGPSLIHDDPSLFTDDVHPNQAGMAMYGRNLARAIRNALGDSRSIKP